MVLELLNMPLAGNADPAMVMHGALGRQRSKDDAGPDDLIQAANLSAALEAMALTVDLRAREVERMDEDGMAADAVRTLQAQAHSLHKAADGLRDARSKRELGQAFNNAHTASINYYSSRSLMLTALHMADDTASHSAKAGGAVAAAKAVYALPAPIVEQRAKVFVQRVVLLDKHQQYQPFAKDVRFHRYMEVPTSGDVIKSFKETASKVDERSLSAEQQHALADVKSQANEAHVNSFNVTDGNVDDAAIRVTGRVLGNRFAEEFRAINGQSVEEFLAEARMTRRGLVPVPEEQIAVHLKEIRTLSNKPNLNEMERADLDMYQRSVSQAQAANKYFEAQEQLKWMLTYRTAKELVLVQESLQQLSGLPPEAVDVHLREAEMRLKKLGAGLEVTEEDERIAASIIRAKDHESILEPAPLLPEITVPECTLLEIDEAAMGIKWHMGSAAMYADPGESLPLQLLPRKKSVIAAVAFAAPGYV